MLAVGSKMDLVVAEENTERLASGHVKLITVDLAKENALVELDGPLKITSQLGPGQNP